MRRRFKMCSGVDTNSTGDIEQVETFVILSKKVAVSSFSQVATCITGQYIFTWCSKIAGNWTKLVDEQLQPSICDDSLDHLLRYLEGFEKKEKNSRYSMCMCFISQSCKLLPHLNTSQQHQHYNYLLWCGFWQV